VEGWKAGGSEQWGRKREARRELSLAQEPVGLTAKRFKESAQEPVGFTAKRLQDSAQGGGFAKPWVSVIKIACSEGAKDPLRAPGYRAVQVHKK
jgi:hypothetical protein